MDFFAKIEQFINQLLLKLGALIYKLIPMPIKNIFLKISAWKQFCVAKLKASPVYIKNLVLNWVTKIKTKFSINFKAIFTDAYKNAMFQYKERSKSNGKFKKIILTPFLIVGQWLQGLSPAQSMLLLAFTGLSVLSTIGIGFSGKRMVDAQVETQRTPASSEEVEYDRPDYYKKQFRHLSVTNFRLPVYFAKINQIKSVDIDFTATLTNRQARKFLEKHEFHLRDHLILYIEPSVASFPLEEEGKEIIRQKILVEINNFLIANEVEGEVTELKITYVLAN